MSTGDLTAALQPVIAAFDSLGIPYHVGGSVASSAYGVARTTLDIDLVAEIAGAQAQPLVARLGTSYYADADMIREAVRHESSFNLIHLPTMLKVDVFVLKHQPYEYQSFARRRPEQLGGEPPLTCYLASPEDVILHKLDWYRLGGAVSDRQWRDVIGVLQIQGQRLDLPYLRRWAADLQVADLLEQVLREAVAE